MSYKLLDYESGEYYEVGKEAYEAHQKMIGNFTAMLNQNMQLKGIGRVTITSTLEDEAKGDDFSKLWNENKNFKTK